MSAQPFVTSPQDYPKPLRVLDEQITVLAPAGATGGYEIFLQRAPEGAGPPPHNHPWDESFYVTKGEIEFGIGADTKVAVTGTLVHIPAGVTHWFRFGKGGAEMVSMTSGAGASALFTDLDREIAPGPPDFEKIMGIAARHSLTVAV
jgi:quercetin dioxygenase-like cupin family protein